MTGRDRDRFNQEQKGMSDYAKKRTRVGWNCIIQEEIKREVWVEEASKTESKEISLTWIMELKRNKQKCCRALIILQKVTREIFSAWVAVRFIRINVFHVQFLDVWIILHLIYSCMVCIVLYCLKTSVKWANYIPVSFI